ncbi:MAG: D-alanyl-D-alanine carboxypeptidase [Candidatus Dormiibacterota bacterium]
MRRVVLGVASLLVLALAIGAAVQLGRPVPRLAAQSHLARSYVVSGPPVTLPWPEQGEAALYLSGFGWIGSSSREESMPIASVTKIMTALVILRAHPLHLGGSGPAITVTAADFALYQTELAQGDSVVRVESGETITEFQALEGLLLPSGDNLAVLLADWQAGSESAFVEKMDQLAVSLHLEQTHFADSSGLDPGSVSSARDLVTLATVAMHNPVFASIVAMPTVSLPVAGTVRNFNPILGQDGVIGIKTGWTEGALGCLVFAAKQSIGGHQVQLIGAVLGQPGGPVSGLAAAGREASLLLTASEAELHQTTLPGGASLVGRVTSKWAVPVAARVTNSVSLTGVAGARVHLDLQWHLLRAPLWRGERVGSLTVTTPGGYRFQEAVVMTRRVAAPDWWWRLTRSL